MPQPSRTLLRPRPGRPVGRPAGRQLMVLDDAETIARQARRRAAARRRQREGLQHLAGISAFVGVAAMVMGAPARLVAAALILLGLALAFAHQQLREHQQDRRRRRRMRTGPGIGTPRPKGGFSTTRHRSGAPVWISADLRDA